MLQKKPLPRFVTGREPFYLMATWGQSGRLLPASGTWGSLAALPFCLAINWIGGDIALAVFALGCFIAGLWAVGRHAQITKSHDSSELVIDEVVGMAITYMFVPINSLIFVCLGFAFFRLFDAVKTGPVGWCDKKIKGAFGVMADDVVAGILAGGLVSFIRMLTV